MIVTLSPKYKFVCDRCGKEIFPNNEGYIPFPAMVTFRSETDYRRNLDKTGEICDECHKEFLEYAENFFDEVNKGKGGAE